MAITFGGALGGAAVKVAVLAGVAVAAWWGYMEWRSTVYQEGYDAAIKVATADCEAKRKAYFDGAAEAAARVEAAASAAADRLTALNEETAANVDATVKTAMRKWKKTPPIVYNKTTNKCAPSVTFQLDWALINKAANARGYVVVPATPGAQK